MRWFGFVVAVIVVGCGEPSFYIAEDVPLKLNVPSGFPPIDYPVGNEPTRLRVELGRRLFYDNRLSSDGSMNCGSCHVLSAAFTDGRSTSPGLHGIAGKRNAPTLANVAWMKRRMMEGGVPTLETQALVPLHDSTEMAASILPLIERLNKDEYLLALSKAAYGRDSVDAFVVTRSLACFQRTFFSGDGRYDRYKIGKKDELNTAEERGMQLFFSTKTHCSECHI